MPKVSNPSVVNSPEQGLIIYDKAANGDGIFERITQNATTYGFRDNVTGNGNSYRFDDGVQISY